MTQEGKGTSNAENSTGDCAERSGVERKLCAEKNGEEPPRASALVQSKLICMGAVLERSDHGNRLMHPPLVLGRALQVRHRRYLITIRFLIQRTP